MLTSPTLLLCTLSFQVNEHRAMKKHVPYAAMSEKTEVYLLLLLAFLNTFLSEYLALISAPREGGTGAYIYLTGILVQ